MTTPDSDALLQLMQAGDVAALDRLARESGTRLLAVARKQCHLAADAEDAVQQALEAASTAMTSYRGDGSPLAWLSTLVARNCSRMNRRYEPTDASAGDKPSVDSYRCHCDDPEKEAERRQFSAALCDALMGLPRADRLLVILSAEGLDGVELSERFGLTHNAVRSRLKRARAQLRDTLSAFDDTTPANPHPRAADERPEPSRHR